MAVRIRLARYGTKKVPFYHVVVADSRSPRDGKYIETLGTYDPLTSPSTIKVDNVKANEWIAKGALPTESARAVLVKSGALEPKKAK